MTTSARNEPPGPHDPDRTVITALREASPSFGPLAEALCSEWSPEIPPGYIEIGEFARHLVDQLVADSTEEFGDVFDVVERLLVNGDPGERYLLTWGLIEDMQNIAWNRDDQSATVRRFRAWLRPATTDAWDEVHRLWGTSRLDGRP